MEIWRRILGLLGPCRTGSEAHEHTGRSSTAGEHEMTRDPLDRGMIPLSGPTTNIRQRPGVEPNNKSPAVYEATRFYATLAGARS